LDAFSQGEHWAGAKYLDYSKAFKGKAQLFWSHGLKDLVGVQEIEDQELAEKQEDKAHLLANLDMWAWDLVLEKKARAEILNIAENAGLPGLIQWFRKYGLDLLDQRYRSSSETLERQPTATVVPFEVEILNTSKGTEYLKIPSLMSG
jgi:hypothetical protein